MMVHTLLLTPVESQVASGTSEVEKLQQMLAEGKSELEAEEQTFRTAQSPSDLWYALQRDLGLSEGLHLGRIPRGSL